VIVLGFSELENEVICADKIPSKLSKLSKGISPIHESGLTELLQKQIKKGKIHFTDKIEEGVSFLKAFYLKKS
jgi:UDPglucose 6-dehydrogenase